MTDAQKRVQSSPSNEELILAKVRSMRPLVHCIVNEAAMSLTANVLLAVNAQPSLTYDPWEARSFTESTNALSINLGMLTDTRRRAIRTSVKSAGQNNIPWVLDPTMIERAESRLYFSKQLLHYKPAIVRANASEMATLCENFELSRQDLSERFNTVLITTGSVDEVVFGEKNQQVESGHHWMDSITGAGCALSALLAATLPVSDNRFQAVVELLSQYAKAGLKAGERAEGPGTFVGHFIDCLHQESHA